MRENVLGVVCAATFAASVASCPDTASRGEACELLSGDLALSEIMADPEDDCDRYTTRATCESAYPRCNWVESNTCGVPSASCNSTDSEREWIEIFNTSSQPVVLDRLVVERTTFQDCGPFTCRHDNCPTGSQCGDDGVCRELVRCQSDGDCDPGWKCGSRLVCELTQTCVTDTDCPTGLSCGECDTCVCHQADGCTGDLVCGADDQCRCEVDAQCPRTGMVCGGDQLCRCPACITDADCPAETRCADDGTCHALSSTDHVIRGAGTLAGRSYLVLGDGVVGLDPVLDYSYAVEDDSLGALSSTSAELALWCKGTLVDAVWYGRVGGPPSLETGRSLSFDSAVLPDALLNDGGDYWCAASGPTYDPPGLNVGTPGTANDTLCGKGSCDDGGTLRNVVSPQVGDLVITEIYAAAPGEDAGKEWVEVLVAGTSAVDLNGLALLNQSTGGSSQSATVAGTTCMTALPGAYAILGVSTDPVANGHVPVLGVAPELELYDGGVLTLQKGRVVIDSATYGDASDGVSLGLDPLYLNASGNDTADHFCPSRTTGLFDETGTPGAANDLCGSTCWDGPMARPPVAPAVGELVITEVFPDPAGSDDYHDWLEIYVAGATTVDLNGLIVRNVNATPTTRTWTLTSATSACLEVSPGTHHVIGGSNVALDGVTATALLGGSTSTLLFAEPSSLAIESGVTIIDTVQYADPGEQHSYSLDPTILDASQNDVAASWCIATGADQFDGGTAWGSPGLANRTDCP